MKILLLLGVIIFINIYAILAAVKQSDLCPNVGLKCTNCTHLELCIAVGNAPSMMRCTGNSPYCNIDHCDSKPSTDCDGGISSNFICPKLDGTYPDPNDCRLYHICINKTATDYSCPNTAVFSTATHSCVRQSVQHPCSTVNCNGKNGQYAVYPPDNRYAFFCVASKSIGIMIHCDENQVYNVDSNKCQARCTKEGVIADPEDKKKFIECTLGVGNNYLMTKRECPNTKDVTSVFNPDRSECVQASTNSTK